MNCAGHIWRCSAFIWLLSKADNHTVECEAPEPFSASIAVMESKWKSRSCWIFHESWNCGTDALTLPIAVYQDWDRSPLSVTNAYSIGSWECAIGPHWIGIPFREDRRGLDTEARFMNDFTQRYMGRGLKTKHYLKFKRAWRWWIVGQKYYIIQRIICHEH